MNLTEEFIRSNLMGPHAILMTEELCKNTDFSAYTRICDLGCGKGLSSLYLADQTAGTVHACDLWIEAEENAERFASLGYSDKIIPVHGDAFELPFSEGYFDALVSIDAYHYFGREPGAIEGIARYVKRGGAILIAVPGLVRTLDASMMEVFSHSWSEENMDTIRTLPWWVELLGLSSAVELESVEEMECFDRAWEAWLACDNEYAIGDRAAMSVGAGGYMNLIAMRLRRV